jgi:hypothetical protein
MESALRMWDALRRQVQVVQLVRARCRVNSTAPQPDVDALTESTCCNQRVTDSHLNYINTIPINGLLGIRYAVKSRVT